MLNRRDFLKRFGIGLTAALTLASLPVAAVEHLTQQVAARRIAVEYMLRRYREMARGRSVSSFPREMRVSHGLYEAYEGELQANERYLGCLHGDDRPGPSLAFKGMRVTADPALARWEDLCFVDRVAA